jgi:diadenylate cyclase
LGGKVLGIFDQYNSLISLLRNSHQPYALLDIVIVGTLFYFFYLFLRQTRALRILYGIVVLLLVWAIGRVLDLTLLNTILRWAFTSILVAVPVVFQPELRSALERLGRTTRLVTDFQRLSKTDIEKITDELIKATTILSKNKYGALIVLTRSSGLREFIDNGVLINATLSHKLLVNIFTPKAPLHDGAVIISGTTIVSASTTLPILEEVFDLSLGTRHKAALSLSMQTDAISLVVSEETGAITLAVDGRLLQHLNKEELKETISKLLKSGRLGLK